jgi:hypothetical protein
MVEYLNSLIISNNHGKGKAYVLHEALKVIIDDELIELPRNFETDFASVPWVFTSLFPKFSKDTNRSAVLHDYLYRVKIFTKEKSDDVFYQGMVADGVSKWRAYPMYLAVRFGGDTAWYGFTDNDDILNDD